MGNTEASERPDASAANGAKRVEAHSADGGENWAETDEIVTIKTDAKMTHKTRITLITTPWPACAVPLAGAETD